MTLDLGISGGGELFHERLSHLRWLATMGKPQSATTSPAVPMNRDRLIIFSSFSDHRAPFNSRNPQFYQNYDSYRRRIIFTNDTIRVDNENSMISRLFSYGNHGQSHGREVSEQERSRMRGWVYKSQQQENKCGYHIQKTPLRLANSNPETLPRRLRNPPPKGTNRIFTLEETIPPKETPHPIEITIHKNHHDPFPPS